MKIAQQEDNIVLDISGGNFNAWMDVLLGDLIVAEVELDEHERRGQSNRDGNLIVGYVQRYKV
jgi:hypothetical protein